MLVRNSAEGEVAGVGSDQDPELLQLRNLALSLACWLGTEFQSLQMFLFLKKDILFFPNQKQHWDSLWLDPLHP
jgi:hypothetical protein